MENMKKRVLSLTLALVLALSLLPIGVLAADETRKVGDVVFTDDAGTLPTEAPGDGFHWVRDEKQDKKETNAGCELAEHAHSAACVTEKHAITEDAYNLGIASADKDMFFAVEQFNYYKLNCGKKDGDTLHVADCYGGLPFSETGAIYVLRRIDGVVCRYKLALVGQKAGWYGLTCENATHTHDAECYTEYHSQPGFGEVRSIGRGKLINGDIITDAATTDVNKIADAVPCMYKAWNLAGEDKVWAEGWYELDCTDSNHVHHHSDTCYTTEGATAEKHDKQESVGFKYYQCTTPAHTHGDGCYKTQYAWVLTADTAVETHTYQVQYLYMLKNAKTGVYEPNGQSAWTIAAAVAKAPDINDIWDSTETQTVNAISYSKGEQIQAKDDIACLEGGKFEENTLQYTIKLYGEQQVATTGTLTIHKTIQNLAESEQSTLTNQLIFDLEGPYEGGIDSVPPFSYDAKGMTLSGLRPGTYSVLEKNQKMPGYDLETTYSWDDADLKTPGQQIAIEAGDNGAITITNTYSKPKNDTTLTIHKIVKGLDGDDAALEALKKSLTFDINGDITFDYSLSVSYGKFIDSSYTTQQLEQTGTYTITETGAEVPGYTLTTSCPEDADSALDGYQVKVEAGKSAQITITNTYAKIPATVYNLIFEAGDNGILQGTTANEIAETTYFWKSDVEKPYWEKAGSEAVSSKKWIYQFTEENVEREIALFAGKGTIAKSPTPAITANDQNNPFQGFYLMKDAQMTDTVYSMDNALFTAYTAMQAAGTDTQTYRAKYSVTTPPVNPPVDPIPPVNPNPPIGGDDEYEPQNPATPPVTTLPNGEVPLAPLPAEETPLSNLPDEETPLADLPEEETPLADAPKTGDSFGIWAALLGISGVAIAGLTLGKRKKTEEN